MITKVKSMIPFESETYVLIMCLLSLSKYDQRPPMIAITLAETVAANNPDLISFFMLEM